MNIKETFLNLTKKTYPYGHEKELVSYLPKGYFTDSHGNYYYKIGKTKTAFTCHLDTACKLQDGVTHIFDGDIIRTDGKTILGADDKAGMTILLYMIFKKVPGLYCFFIGEEVGCIGSGKASEDKTFKEYDRMISFDRRGTSSIITFQSSKRCCSDSFANALSNQYNKMGMDMRPDDTGVYTDSAEFTGVIPECTNISVGYYSEHTTNEHQDIKHLENIAKASTMIEWESLPTKRNPLNVDYKPYVYGNRRHKSEKSYTSYQHCDIGYDEELSTTKEKFYAEDSYYEDSYQDWYYDDTQLRWKKKKNGKAFFETVDNEITDNYKSTGTKRYYEGLKQNLYDDRLSERDYNIINEQYLDLNDSDREFYLGY